MTTVSPWNVDSATSTINKNLIVNNGKQTGQTNLQQTDYLKLLTAQIQYQDPFNPVDNTQMVAQMTQFSQLQGQVEANKTLTTIADSLGGSRLSGAASWIGRSLLVKSPTVAPNAAGEYAGQVKISGATEGMSVDLVDGANNVVRSIDLGAHGAGDVPFYWDGRDEQGNPVSAGPLTIRVSGATPVSTAAWTSVAAVQSPASGTDAKLITTLGTFTAADALSLG